LRAVGNGFNDVQLIQQSASRGHLRQVLRFINQHGYGPPEAEGLLERVPILRPNGSTPWQKSRTATLFSAGIAWDSLEIDERFIHH
jgi:hypothetical protein